MTSIFTNDFDTCAITHIHRGARRIECHHVYGGANRKRSTRYGFVIPLVDVIHINGSAANDKECKRLTGRSLKDLDLYLKRTCQRYYETNIGTRRQFLDEFGRSYL